MLCHIAAIFNVSQSWLDVTENTLRSFTPNTVPRSVDAAETQTSDLCRLYLTFLNALLSRLNYSKIRFDLFGLPLYFF